jgi:hypothetical protein
MDVSIRALTICQPHAFFIVARPDELPVMPIGESDERRLTPKRVENRCWYTRYRGELLIHTGASHAWMKGWRWANMAGLHFSAIIGVAKLIECVHHTEDESAIRRFWPWVYEHDHTDADGYHWLLDNVRRFKQPVPWKGAQGLWKPGYLHGTPEGRLLRQAISTAEPVDWSPAAALATA